MRLKMGQHGASETPGFGKLLPEVFSAYAFGKGEKAMAQESVNYQCPNCMGPLRYKGDSGMLECEFCESTFTPAQVEEAYAAKQREADEKARGRGGTRRSRRAIKLRAHGRRGRRGVVGGHRGRHRRCRGGGRPGRKLHRFVSLACQLERGGARRHAHATCARRAARS